MTVGQRRIATAVSGPLVPGRATPGPAAAVLTVRRYIDHALICSACCR
ncbi:hypothetical protein BX285_5666 [Streptomyces sp. 1114.5]|nr:hypothetical protein BX285_5666 [Streptomyces sp. 1114.5]SOB80671.1 hypothetical protein SAMN06272789_1063 [Streptomyces sp. 1331.2]